MPLDDERMTGGTPTASTAARPSLWRNRDFVLLWSGLAISVLGSRISHVAYPLLVLAMSGSALLAGVVGFLATIPYLLFQLPAGVLVDRWNRRRLMIVCDIGRGVALATVVGALWVDRVSVAHLMAVAFLEGTLFVFYNLAQAAAVKHVVAPDQVGIALAQNEARERGAALLGQPLGGILFGVARWLPFLADALSYVASLVALLLIRTEFEHHEPQTPAQRRLAAEVREGLVWLWHQPFLRATAILVAGSNLLFQALVLIFIVLARDQGASPSVIGTILASFGVGGLLGSLAAPWLGRRLSMPMVVIGANWVWAAATPLLAIMPSVYLLGIIFVGMAFVGPVWNVTIDAYSLAVIPDRLLGRVSSVVTMFAYGAIPLGSLAAGFLLATISAQGGILVLAGFMVVLAAGASASPAVRHAPRLEHATQLPVPEAPAGQIPKSEPPATA